MVMVKTGIDGEGLQVPVINCRVKGWGKNIQAPWGRDAYRIESICKSQASAGVKWTKDI